MDCVSCLYDLRTELFLMSLGALEDKLYEVNSEKEEIAQEGNSSVYDEDSIAINSGNFVGVSLDGLWSLL